MESVSCSVKYIQGLIYRLLNKFIRINYIIKDIGIMNIIVFCFIEITCREGDNE